MKLLSTLVVALGLVVAVVPFAAAQNAPSNFLNVLTITVHPGKVVDFENFARKVQEAGEEIGDPRTVQMFQGRLGGLTTQYLAVTLFNDWAEMDSWPTVPQMLVEA
jgi:hypothetical protein